MENKTALNRTFINGKNNCFITMKDHKENFLNNPKTRQINQETLKASKNNGNNSSKAFQLKSHSLRNSNAASVAHRYALNFGKLI